MSCYLVFPQPLKIAVVSDIHFMSSQLAVEGSALSEYEKSTTRNVKTLHEVLNKAISEIIDEEVDILLISGDITNHGEKQSHLDFIEKIKPLKDKGVKVFVIPGNHDINIPNPKSYIGSKVETVRSVSPKEFVSLYNSYGYEQSIDRDDNSLSYVVELNQSTWLLALDTNLYDRYDTAYTSAGQIKPETMKWTLGVLDKAQEQSITVIGMMHHGLVEHLPYQSTFFSDYLIRDWRSNAQLLADAGLKLMLTGHFHANDVTLLTSSKGNVIYDIETGSLAHYPFPYRIMTLDEKTLSIETNLIDSVSSEPNLQNKHLKRHEEFSKKVVSNRLKSIGVPLSGDVKKALTDLLTRMSVLHAVGDEVISEDTYQIIKKYADTMGDDNFDISIFSIDFPPSDNNLVIKLR